MSIKAFNWNWDNYTAYYVEHGCIRPFSLSNILEHSISELTEGIESISAYFKTSKWKYKVIIKRHCFKENNNFFIIHFAVKSGSEWNFDIEVNETSDVYRVMATLVEIIKDAVRILKCKHLIITPDQDYARDLRRVNLYLRYLKRHLPESAVKLESTTWKKHGKEFSDEVIIVDLKDFT